MRHSDRPIFHPREDVFDRSAFALTLARSIENLAIARDGFVIGLIGPWGSGKSSVVELTVRHLKHLEMQRKALECGEKLDLATLDRMADCFQTVEPIIASMRANNLDVYLWDRNHRADDFLKYCGNPEDAALATKYWYLLQQVEKATDTIIIRFSPWLIAGRAELASALMSDVARELGEKLGSEITEAFAALLERLAQAVPLAGAAVDMTPVGGLGGLFSAAFDVSNRLAKRMTSGPTLDSAREKLRARLRAIKNSKILIVIDDLDRLTPDEAVEMVSLVKGLGDLPNVIYLLCYDEVRLAKLIHVSLKLNGQEYLEKIVQYAVHLPPLDHIDLSRLLESDLTVLLPELDSTDRQRLTQAWFSVIRHYTRTPRDVRRLMNSYSVAIAGLGDHTDPIDLLLLETLRVNEPSLYSYIRSNLGDFVR